MLTKTLPVSAAPQAALAAAVAGRTCTLWGAQATTLGLQVATRVAQQGRTVRWICGDNRFDPYRVAEEAEAHEMYAEVALGQMQIARAFTAYQLTELVLRLRPENETGLVIVSGLCTSFLDEDVPNTDAARLYYRTLWRTVRLTAQGLALLVIQQPPRLKTRRSYFLDDLQRVSHRVLDVSGKETVTLTTKLRAGLQYLTTNEQERNQYGENRGDVYANARQLPATLEQGAPRFTAGRPIGMGSFV